MVTHAVAFKLKNPTDEVLAETKKKLLSMDGNVPQLRYLEVGVDQLRTPRSYDILLITRFDSWEDAQAYNTHPFHQTVVQYMHGVAEAATAIDYED